MSFSFLQSLFGPNQAQAQSPAQPTSTPMPMPSPIMSSIVGSPTPAPTDYVQTSRQPVASVPPNIHGGGAPDVDDSDDNESDDSTKPSDVNPVAASSQTKADDLTKNFVTPDDLTNMTDEKRRALALGAALNAVGNTNSFGNYFLGHLRPQHDYSQLANGMMKNAELPIQAKQTLMAQAIQKPQIQYLQDMQDPSSTASKLHKVLASGAIQAAMQNPQWKGSPDIQKAMGQMTQMLNDPNTSGLDIQKAIDGNPLMKDMMQDSIQGQRLQQMMNYRGAMLDLAGKRLGMQEDTQAQHAADTIDKNPLIVESQRQLGQLQRDRHTVETAPIITPQMLHEISNGIANALAGGKGVGLGMAEMQDLSTSQTALAKWEQTLTNAPQNGASDAVKKQIIDTLNRLEDAYGKYQGALANRLKQGRQYSHNPQAQQTLNDAAQKYQVTRDPKIEQFAKDNGVTYDQANTALRARGYNGGQ